MRIGIEKPANYFLGGTQIPNIFISEYMPDIPGDYLKVYLYVYMAAEAKLALTEHSVAAKLGISEETVAEAWSYLAKRGLAIRRGGDIVLTDIKGRIFGGSAKGEDAAALGTGGNEDVRKLMSDIENISGKPLSSADYEKIANLLTDGGALPELVSYAYKYCAQRPRMKTNASYVCELVRRWMDEGIVTGSDAEDYVQAYDARYQIYKKLARALGMSLKSLTDPEKAVFDKWLDEYGFTEDEIIEKCNKSAGKDNKFDYMKKVIENDRKARGASRSESSTKDMDRRLWYKEKQERKAKEAEDRKREVYRKIPRIREIDEEMSAKNLEKIDIATSGAPNRKQVGQEITKAIAELAKERLMLLTTSGFGKDYTEIRYDCLLCKDSGVKEDESTCACYFQMTGK